LDEVEDDDPLFKLSKPFPKEKYVKAKMCHVCYKEASKLTNWYAK
jgi:hypothetical protein